MTFFRGRLRLGAAPRAQDGLSVLVAEGRLMTKD